MALRGAGSAQNTTRMHAEKHAQGCSWLLFTAAQATVMKQQLLQTQWNARSVFLMKQPSALSGRDPQS